MTQMATVEVLDLQQLEDLEIPCDYSEKSWCPDSPARWIAHVRHECGYVSQRLICDPCKNLVIVSDYDCFECRSCGELVFPARRAFYRIDAL